MVSLNNLYLDVEQIKKRNQKVESDKAWETSFFRRFIITLMTYFIVVLFFWIIKVPYFWLNALVPTGGFVLSTLSLPFIKKWWVKNRYNK
jgi:hypothetical protein